MFFFEGTSCPVCEKPFCSDDDIVACPECGAPFHRACYKENGGCPFEAQHAEGFVWKREPIHTDDAPSADEPAEVRCPVCGTANSSGRLYCQNCTNPLYSDVSGAERGGSQGGFVGLGFDGVPISESETIGGVPVGDMNRFLGTSAYLFTPMFVNFERKKSLVSFNLIACFMHGMWFISRKMYVLGGIILAVMLGIYTYQFSCYDVIMPYYEQLIAGDMTASVAMLTEHPVMTVIMMATTVIQYSVYILSGLFANRIYMSHCVRQIKHINATSNSPEQFNRRLETEGGQSLLVALVAVILYFAVQYIVQNHFV